MDKRQSWHAVARVFDRQAAVYDAWFEESEIYAAELACLRAVRTPQARPFLEVGVGPGRFARDLDVDFGIDPAAGALRLAAGRGIGVCQAVAGHLPVRNETMGTVFLLFTLCFLDQPGEALAEISRVLMPGGHLVCAVIPADGTCGRAIARKKEAGHAFYQYVRLRSAAAIEQLLTGHGFRLVETLSTLCGPPQEPESARCRRQLVHDAGCVIFVGVNRPLKNGA